MPIKSQYWSNWAETCTVDHFHDGKEEINKNFRKIEFYMVSPFFQGVSRESPSSKFTSFYLQKLSNFIFDFWINSNLTQNSVVLKKEFRFTNFYEYFTHLSEYLLQKKTTSKPFVCMKWDTFRKRMFFYFDFFSQLVQYVTSQLKYWFFQFIFGIFVT